MGYIGKVTTPDGNTRLIGSTLYGTCSTAASTAAKVVTLRDFNALTTGVTIHVKFTYSNTASSPTLNVNNTGAKNIKVHGATGVGNTPYKSWFPGEIISFTYDGTNWCVNDYKDNSNIIFEKSEDNEREIVITDDGIITEDSEPYNYRQSAGGGTELDELVGGTVAWNQLVEDGDFSSTSRWIASNLTLSVSDNVLTLTSQIASSQYVTQRYNQDFINGHKYVCTFDVRANSSGHKIGASLNSSTLTVNTLIPATTDIPTTWGTLRGIVEFATSGSGDNALRIGIPSTEALPVGDYIQLRNVQLIDLTQLFGSTIADYIYSLEQSTAGAGVAWLKERFPKLFADGYKAYNTGELTSVRTSAHEMVGFNQWDEQWESGYISTSNGQNVNGNNIRSKSYIAVLPDMAYYGRDGGSGSLYVLHYDCNYNYLGSYSRADNRGFVTPSNCAYIRFYCDVAYGTTYNNDICINISDAQKNGTYEPYAKYSYPLSPVELRGLFKLDANNKLYCDGDSYRCDGRVKRRYGIVDLGTLNWVYIGSALAFSASVTNIKPTVDVSTKANAICSKYQVITRNERENGGLVVIWAQSEAVGKIYVYDSTYSDAATFKTAMSGIYLVYELATPTEEYTSPFEKNQAVDAGGTEEYIDDRSVSVPVGHSTKYYRGLYLNKKTNWTNVIKPPGGNLIYNVRGTQTSATASWTGNIEVPELYDGLSINYYLPYAGVSGTNVTLNLTLSDGTTTGAKNCYLTTDRLTTHYGAGRTIMMTYYSAGSIKISGTPTTDDRWICDAYYDSNDGAYYDRVSYVYMKAGPGKIYPYTIICQLPDGRWESVVTSGTTATSKAKNTHGFLFKQIRFMYANKTYSENARIDNSNVFLRHSSTSDTRRSFNTANNATYGLTTQKPVYLVGTIGTDGLFYLADTWWTQILPSTEDGKVYIELGEAYDYCRFAQFNVGEAFVYTNGHLRQFSQDAATVNGHTVQKDVPSNAVFTDNNTWRNLKYINTADTTADLAGTGPGTGYIVYDGGSSSALKTTVSSGYSSISVSPTRVVAVSASQPSLTDLPKGGIWLQLI